MTNIVDAFKIPVYRVSLDLNLKTMLTHCNYLRKIDKGMTRSNSGGWHSNFLNGIHRPLNNLFLEIEKHSRLFSHQLSVDHIVNMDKIWVNINGTSDFNVAHIHPNCLLSGVFYVKVPKDSGNLVFMNPACDTMIYDWKNFKTFNGYNSASLSFTPKENELFMFPSWLKHQVDPNNSKKERVSLSFNCS